MKILSLIISLHFCITIAFSQSDNTPKIIFDFLPNKSEWISNESNQLNQINFVETKDNYYSIFYNKQNNLDFLIIHNSSNGDDLETFYFKKNNTVIYHYLMGNHKHTYEYVNEVLYSLSTYNQDSIITNYYYNTGEIEEIYYYYFNLQKQVKKVEFFYKNGNLSTRAIFNKGKIISIKEFDNEQNELNDTYIDENGNGHWYQCMEDGSNCCDCEIKKGKLKNCDTFSNK